MESNDRLGLILLTILAGALLLVGVVSGTLLRHAVQIVPSAVLILLAIVWRPRGWPAAALAIDLFWLPIMVLIWLYLAGVSRILTGHFSTSEIACTIVIGAAAVGGIIVALRSRGATRLARVSFFLIWAVFQVGAMWFSVRPGIGAR
jgi:hypothetical protein